MFDPQAQFILRVLCRYTFRVFLFTGILACVKASGSGRQLEGPSWHLLNLEDSPPPQPTHPLEGGGGGRTLDKIDGDLDHSDADPDPCTF